LAHATDRAIGKPATVERVKMACDKVVETLACRVTIILRKEIS